MIPGLTALTMTDGASAAAAERVMLTTAALEALYGAESGPGRIAAAEARFTTCAGAVAARRPGSAATMHRYVPTALIRKVRSHVAGSKPSKRSKTITPAQLTSTSTTGSRA